MKQRFRFERLDGGYLSEPELDALLETVAAVAAKTAALNRSLKVHGSKTPFRHEGGAAFDPRRSTFD